MEMSCYTTTAIIKLFGPQTRLGLIQLISLCKRMGTWSFIIHPVVRYGPAIQTTTLAQCLRFKTTVTLSSIERVLQRLRTTLCGHQELTGGSGRMTTPCWRPDDSGRRSPSPGKFVRRHIAKCCCDT